MIRDGGDHITVDVRVTPRSVREDAVLTDGILKVRLKAPPVEGEANAALVRFLSRKTGIRQSEITIIRGDTGRSKVLRFNGLNLSGLTEAFPDKSS